MKTILSTVCALSFGFLLSMPIFALHENEIYFDSKQAVREKRARDHRFTHNNFYENAKSTEEALGEHRWYKRICYKASQCVEPRNCISWHELQKLKPDDSRKYHKIMRAKEKALNCDCSACSGIVLYIGSYIFCDEEHSKEQPMKPDVIQDIRIQYNTKYQNLVTKKKS
jgi:hypothetical protein